MHRPALYVVGTLKFIIAKNFRSHRSDLAHAQCVIDKLWHQWPADYIWRLHSRTGVGAISSRFMTRSRCPSTRRHVIFFLSVAAHTEFLGLHVWLVLGTVTPSERLSLSPSCNPILIIKLQNIFFNMLSINSCDFFFVLHSKMKTPVRCEWDEVNIIKS